MGGSVPSATWVTKNVPDQWRNSTPAPAAAAEVIDAHDFFRYSLLLRAMAASFDEEDSIVWFDDALFFLRGGYNFFCHLNIASDMTMRGTVFGGLNHAQGPSQDLEAWLNRFVDEARARKASTVDVLVSEEINSGSSAHRIMNVIRDALPKLSPGQPLTVDFWFYLACTDDSVFDVPRFTVEVQSKRRITSGSIAVRNNFRLFQGPLLGYDEERYSGLRVNSAGSAATESYTCVRHRATTVHLRCPNTGQEPFWCAPGSNDLDNFVGVLASQLLEGRDSVQRKIITRRLQDQSCELCKELFAKLRGPNLAWPSRML